MKSNLLSILFISFSFTQNYSLDFDGSSDYVEITDGSTVIANTEQMTLSGWVYPRGPNADSYTQFDGFFGFRNNEDADFYLIQLGDYKVECRLRVSDGGEFTIVTAENSIISETWHHLALTYDGSNIILYIDGIEAGSTGAFGQIINQFVPFNIGRLIWQTTNFDLDGQVDEVSLWNLALTEQQVQDYMYADLTGEEGLVGYWKLNEGDGSIAYDSSGEGNNGMIYGATWSTDTPGPSTITVNVNYNEGWNLVGLPLSVDDAGYLSIFPEAISGTLYSFEGGYISENELFGGVGYWLRFPESISIDIMGVPINEITISLNEGWNLITGITFETNTNSIQDPGEIIVPETFYDFDNGYGLVDELIPGHGYWVRANNSGNIIVVSE
ncbi:uncharacterized protein METZ01_LOCUS209509 [marine metagenome]|uniref:LamG-like jellyroll fold domain-containing protein n=1 Tax=marine metagenome TaxID=408172 RepID=A0A382F1W5_9ZZZZ